jgi:hypothetical protein
MFNPWIFGLESMHQAWRAQSALAFRMVELFGGGHPDQTPLSPMIPDIIGIKRQEEAPIAGTPKRRKTAKTARPSKNISPVKSQIVAKRAAAASQNRASKAARRSGRKSR